MHNITKTNQSQVRGTEVGGAAESPLHAQHSPRCHMLGIGKGLSWHRWQSRSQGLREQKAPSEPPCANPSAQSSPCSSAPAPTPPRDSLQAASLRSAGITAITGISAPCPSSELPFPNDSGAKSKCIVTGTAVMAGESPPGQ